jgi:hypothetical protein
MDQPTDDELDLLLSRGHLRGPVAERARERLLDSAAPAPPPWWRRIRFVLPVLATAMAATAGLVLVARTPSDPNQPTGEFRNKGGSGRSALLGLTCAGASADHCPRGARVSVAVSGGSAGYLGGYAEPEGGGERIWYFSVEDGIAALTGGSDQARLVSRSILLGPEHQAARYRVQLLLAARPLSRAEILDQKTPGVLARQSFSLNVVAP